MSRSAFVLLVASSLLTAAHANAQSTLDCAKVRASTDHATMNHAEHAGQLQQCAAAALPTLPGQAAFGAISEIVGMLTADANTDWSRVNIESLRQHLIDMDAVTMRAVISQRAVPGGFEARVTGDDPTMGAIRRMLGAHSKMVSQADDYRATTVDIPGGSLLTIVAANSTDSTVVAKIRGLGVIGLLTVGDHHVRHHLALARGDDGAHEH
ncbi:MAG: hypothetical protein U0132_20510 [Gemmatimonadaceae bacterium]